MAFSYADQLLERTLIYIKLKEESRYWTIVNQEELNDLMYEIRDYIQQTDIEGEE